MAAQKKTIWEFRLGSVENLRRLCGRLGCKLDAIEDVSILAEPVQAGPLLIPNSLAIHPMEGADGDSHGRPGKLSFRRYERFGAGGAGLIWAEATAVAGEGRSNPRQFWLNEDSKESFAALIRRTREAAKINGADFKPVIVAQLTYSGRYSRPEGAPHPLIVQRDPYRDAMRPQQKPDSNSASSIPDDWPVLTDEYLDGLVDAYVSAARLAFEAGFDAVDVKSCHGYLVNELLGARGREGKYGGPFENRTSFLLEVIHRIRSELGEDKTIVTRLGIYDAIPYPYGWGVDKDDYRKPDLTEPKRLVELLRRRGVKLINITVGNPYYSPHFGRPFNEAIVGGYQSPEHPLAGVSRLIELAGEIQREFADVAVVGTGYSWLRTLMPNVAAASKAKGLAAIVGAGRMAFAYPDFARDIIRTGRLDPAKVCVCCSGCTQIMRDGGMIGCVVRDNKIYGPIFRQGRMRDRDNLLRLASACRQCREPTCKIACPAGIDIPGFVRLFLDGDDRGAYEIIREANIFAEVCARLCPVEQQCQGSCLERFIGDGALPIAAIQRYLAEQANKHGWSKLRLPEKDSGSSVAIIGAGPAGLACAAKLLEAGHVVTLFDKNAQLGGLITSVIPGYRQGESFENEVGAIFEDVPPDRMILKGGKKLDAEFNLDSVINQGFDAVFIGIGLPESAGGDDEKSDRLYSAMEFLAAAKRTNKLNVTGKKVAVIGGGNTAMDVAVTAGSLGAADVYIIYRRSFAEMPAWISERDGAMAEGVHFLILTQPLRYISANGKLTGLRVCPTRLGQVDSSGRRTPEPVQKSAYDLDMDIVVEAMGQAATQGLDKILAGVEFKEGLIRLKDGSFETTRPAVFAGGDMVHGASTVVAAVADGMNAAEEIDLFLRDRREAT